MKKRSIRKVWYLFKIAARYIFRNSDYIVSLLFLGTVIVQISYLSAGYLMPSTRLIFLGLFAAFTLSASMVVYYSNLLGRWSDVDDYGKFSYATRKPSKARKMQREFFRFFAPTFNIILPILCIVVCLMWYKIVTDLSSTEGRKASKSYFLQAENGAYVFTNSYPQSGKFKLIMGFQNPITNVYHLAYEDDENKYTINASYAVEFSTKKIYPNAVVTSMDTVKEILNSNFTTQILPQVKTRISQKDVCLPSIIEYSFVWDDPLIDSKMEDLNIERKDILVSVTTQPKLKPLAHK